MKNSLSTLLRTLTVVAVLGVSFATARAACLQISALSPQPSTAGAGDQSSDSTEDSDATVSSDANSKVRIVRLSQVLGEVEVYRQTGQGYEPALVNLPVVEGTELRTGKGFAEVEFEDDSLLHLAPNTIVEFPRLELSSSGSKITTVNVESGTVYVSLAQTPGNEFELTFAHQKAQLPPSSHVRLLIDAKWASLSVLHGSVRVETPTGESEEVKNGTVNFEFLIPTETTKNANAKGPYDEWDKNAVEYHKRFGKADSDARLANAYGSSDLRYYGRFVSNGDCGVVWRPFFANLTWDPFANGAWVWYPEGYTWVSPYPWGWTPYHSGAWEYCPNYGWGWRPYGEWRGIGYIPQFGPRTVKPRYGPLHPPRPPRTGEPRVVTVTRELPGIPGSNVGSRLITLENSAGLGIPRTTNVDLNHASKELEHHGPDSTAVRKVAAIAGTVRAAGQGYVSSSGRATEVRTREANPIGNRSSGGSPRPSYADGGGSRSPTPHSSSSYSGGHSSGESASHASGSGNSGGRK